MDGQDRTSSHRSNDSAPGIIGGGARILKELLRSPRVTKTARILLSNLDPEASPELVRTLVYGDTALFFDLLSATPELANAAILGLREGAEQLQQLPHALVDGFASQLLEKLDAEALGEGAALVVLALGQLLGGDQTALSERLAAFERGVVRGWNKAVSTGAVERQALLSATVGAALGAADRAAGQLDDALDEGTALSQAVTQAADGIRQLAKDHPRTMNQLVRPLVAASHAALEG